MRNVQGRVCTDPVINAALEIPKPSPYGVPIHRLSVVPSLKKSDELLPFEQDQLHRLIGQLNASAPRVRSAFLAHIRSNRLK